MPLLSLLKQGKKLGFVHFTQSFWLESPAFIFSLNSLTVSFFRSTVVLELLVLVAATSFWLSPTLGLGLVFRVSLMSVSQYSFFLFAYFLFSRSWPLKAYCRASSWSTSRVASHLFDFWKYNFLASSLFFSTPCPVNILTP